jgi:hypothetical protein
MNLFSQFKRLDESPLKSILLFFCVKFLLFGAMMIIEPSMNDAFQVFGIFHETSDTEEFLRPIENLVDHSNYSLQPEGIPFAGRLPGYIFPYVLFYALFPRIIALLLLGISQVLFSSIGVYLAAKTAFIISRNRIAYLLTALFLLLFPFYWQYDFILHPTALSILTSAGFVYFFIQYFISKQPSRSLLIASFLLISSIFMRPFLILLVFAPLPFIILKEKTLRQIIIHLTIFALPIVITESVWIARNALAMNKFIPLQTSFSPVGEKEDSHYGRNNPTKPSIEALRGFIGSWGGDCVWYFKDSEMGWFLDKKPNSVPPENLNQGLSGSLNLDSLIALKKLVRESYDIKLSDDENQKVEQGLITKSKKYKDIYISEKPLSFVFITPVKRLKNFLYRNVTQAWHGPNFEKGNVAWKMIKLFSLLSYSLVLISSFFLSLSRVLFLKKQKKALNIFILLSILSILAIFTWFIPFVHFDYFIFGTILCTILLTSNISYVLKNLTIIKSMEIAD